MVHLLSLLSILFCLSAQAQVVPSGVPKIDIGSAEISENNTYHSGITDGGWFMLVGAGSPGVSNFNPLVRNGVAYQVTSGKTAKCTSLHWGGNGAGIEFQFVSDTSAITIGDTALTAGVYEGGATNQPAHVNTTANVYVEEPFLYNFASATYPGYQAGNAATNYRIHLFCKEVSN